ncbi:hypothetical protein EJ07DRAFT_159099 [Lizonia empirigonia]|nr:hypothetical protein EJ07DRAFT_159099 [Lizonia empirigonia]
MASRKSSRHNKDDKGNVIRTDEAPGRAVADPSKSAMENTPKTKEEMQVWMKNTRKELLEFLTWCRCKAHEQPAFDNIKDMRNKNDSEWTENWEAQTDIQTGEIHDQVTRDRMFEAMQPRYKKLSKRLAIKKGVHRQYAWAQCLWEDFHYYQNEWNRRVSRDKKPEDQEPEDITEDVRWVKTLLELYDKFGIGVRSKTADVVGVEEAHRYPENVRGTRTNPSTLRREYLQAKYPESSIRFDEAEIDAKRAEVNKWRSQQETFDPTALPDSLSALKPYSAAIGHKRKDDTGSKPAMSWATQDWGEAVGNAKQVPLNAIPHNRKRYETKPVRSLVRKFVYIKTEDPTDPFLGHYVNMFQLIDRFVYDENDERVEIVFPEKERENHDPLTHDYYSGTVKNRGPVLYTIPEEHNADQGPGRREVAESRVAAGKAKHWRRKDAVKDDDRNAEFSDDEPDGDAGLPGSGDPGAPAPDSEDDEDDDEDDDEYDLFTVYYQGRPLPTFEPLDRVGPDTRKGDEDDNDEDSSEDGDDPGNNGGAAAKTGVEKPPKTRKRLEAGAKSKNPKKKKTTAGKRVSRHTPRTPEESFEAIPGDDNWDMATYVHEHSDGSIFTHSIRVPAFNPNAEPEPPSLGGFAARKIYPVHTEPNTCVIPANISRKTPWRRDTASDAPNGRWVSGKDEWFPTPILRAFHLGNNKYEGCYINAHFEAVIKHGFKYKDIAKFNRKAHQHLRRGDKEVHEIIEGKKSGPWTDGELNLLREYIRRTIQRDGLVNWLNDWTDTHLTEVVKRINKHREDHGVERKERTKDSVRCKCKRDYASLLEQAKQLKERQESGKTLSEAELRPDVLSEVIVSKKKSDSKNKTATEAGDEMSDDEE